MFYVLLHLSSVNLVCVCVFFAYPLPAFWFVAGDLVMCRLFLRCSCDIWLDYGSFLELLIL